MKPLLILDIDETLLHASKTKLSYNHDFEIYEYWVYLRPGLEAFLRKIPVDYKLALWSSAGEYYVNALAKQLESMRAGFEFVWHREQCTNRYHFHLDDYIPEKHLYKVKRKKGIPLERMLIVDNTPEKCIQNYGNAIYIDSYYGGPDEALLQLSNYLSKIKDIPNFRKLEKRHWRNT